MQLRQREQALLFQYASSSVSTAAISRGSSKGNTSVIWHACASGKLLRAGILPNWLATALMHKSLSGNNRGGAALIGNQYWSVKMLSSTTTVTAVH